MKLKILTAVLTAMVVTCTTAFPHHPIFFGNSPSRQGFLANREVVYSPYYDNPARLPMLSSPQFINPSQLYLVPPNQGGVNYVPIQQSQHPVASKEVGLSRDQINFCKVVGNSLATTPPSSLLLETPLDVDMMPGGYEAIDPATTKSSEDPNGPRRRQSVGPINLNYMCKRITRLPIPGQIGVPTLVRYCKRLAHTISSNVPFLLREVPASPWQQQQQVQEINFSGLYEQQKPLRAIPTEAYNIAVLCQTMLQQIVNNVEFPEINLDNVGEDESMAPMDEKKQSTTSEQMKPEMPMEMVTTEVSLDTIQPTEPIELEESVTPEADEEIKPDEAVTPDVTMETMEEETMKPMEAVTTDASMEPMKDEKMNAMEAVTPDATMESMKDQKVKPIEPAMSEAPMKPVQAVGPQIALDLTQLPVLPVDSGVQGYPGIQFLIKNPIPSHIRQFIIVSPPQSGLVQNSPADTYVLQQNQPQAMQQFVLHHTHG